MITRDSTEEDTGKAKNPKATLLASSNAPTPIWGAGSSSSRPRDPRIVRASRALGGKDRHSKVFTARGLRDRRVRLSVSTAIQLYDLQDRLGLNQPSKVVDWLLNAAKHGIDELPPLQVPQGFFTPHFQNLLENSKPIIRSKNVSTPAEESASSGNNGNLNQGSFQEVYNNNPFLVNPSLALICPPPKTLGSTAQIDHDFSSLAQLPSAISSSSGSQNYHQPGISSQPCLPSQICGNSARSNELLNTWEMMSFSTSQVSNSLPVYQFTSQPPAAAAVVRPIFPFTMSPNILPNWQKYYTDIEQNKGSNNFPS